MSWTRPRAVWSTRAMSAVTDRPPIGWLNAGAMDRRELTESAVLMALVPRIRRDLYFA